VEAGPQLQPMLASARHFGVGRY